MSTTNPKITTPLSHFEKRLSLIARFISREGHANIPLEQKEDGQPIGYWCSNWRFRIETDFDTIPTEQIEALRRAGVFNDGVSCQKVVPPAPAPQPPLAPTPKPALTPAPKSAPRAVSVQAPQARPKLLQVPRAKQAAEDHAFCIPTEWMQPSQPQTAQPEVWLLPVGSLSQTNPSPSALTAKVVKKRRWQESRA